MNSRCGLRMCFVWGLALMCAQGAEAAVLRLEEPIWCSDPYWLDEESVTEDEETVCDLGGKVQRIAFKPDCKAGESCFRTNIDSIHQASSFKLCGPGAEIFSFQRSGAVHFVTLRTGKELASIATNPFTMFCNESSAFVVPMHEPPQRRTIEKHSWGRAGKTTYVQVGDRNRFNPPFSLELVNNDTLRLKDGFGSLDFARVSR